MRIRRVSEIEDLQAVAVSDIGCAAAADLQTFLKIRRQQLLRDQIDIEAVIALTAVNKNFPALAVEEAFLCGIAAVAIHCAVVNDAGTVQPNIISIVAAELLDALQRTVIRLEYKIIRGAFPAVRLLEG